ncbi:hypothetical protein BH23CHL9_BH23CHL9_15210 [soil metagenome]
MTRATDDVLELERQFWTRADDPDHFRASYADEGLTVIEPMGFAARIRR